MTTTLIIIRHGQTVWNKDERFRGRTDLALDETGRRQAEAAARRVAVEYRPAAVLASPLQRALQTAETIARPLGLRVEPDEDLLDLDYGDFAGLSPAEVESRFFGLYHTWLSAPRVVHFPHGESLEDVRNRTANLIQRITYHYPDEQVVLVSHLVVCRVLLCSLLGVHNGYVGHFRVDPASITVFELGQSSPVLVTANDVCHLATLPE